MGVIRVVLTGVTGNAGTGAVRALAADRTIADALPPAPAGAGARGASV
ncbi:hypothetical protein ACIRP0_05730 [Streptomyces sp. NPDC101733]